MSQFALTFNQVATIWTQTGLDTYGKPTFTAPAQINVRWEDRTEMILSKRGEEYVSKSRVFFGSDIPLEAFLFLGTSAATDPTAVPGAYEVMGRKMTPDLRNLQQLYVAFL